MEEISEKHIRDFKNKFEKIISEFNNIDKEIIINKFIEIIEIPLKESSINNSTDNNNLIDAKVRNELASVYGLKFKGVLESEIITLIKYNDFDTYNHINFLLDIKDYLNKKFFSLITQREPSPTKNSGPNKRGPKPKTYDKNIVKWHGSKLDFIKLIYALHKNNNFDNKKYGVTVVTKELANIMGVDYEKDDNDLSQATSKMNSGNVSEESFYKIFKDIESAFRNWAADKIVKSRKL